VSALTSLLARDQAVPVRKIEEALQKQVLSGGDIGTVLLELEAIAENTLAAYQAALAGVLPATRDEVMKVTRETLRLVPREIAEKHRMIPLAVDGRALLVAVAAPLSANVESQLGFSLGYELVQRVVCDVRIAAGLSHLYAVEPAARQRRLIEKLRHRDAGAVPYVAPPQLEKVSRMSLTDLPSKRSSAASWLDDDDEESVSLVPKAPKPKSEPPAPIAPDPSNETSEDTPLELPRMTMPGVAPPQRPPSVPPQIVGSGTLAAPVVGVGVTRSSRPPPPQRPIATLASSVPAPPMPSTPATDLTEAQRAIRKLHGPLTAAKAVELLDGATGRDDVLSVFFAFARQFFDYSALFAVTAEVAEGRDAFGQGATADEVRKLTFPLDAPGRLAIARRLREPTLEPMNTSEIDAQITRELRRPPKVLALLVPIALRERTVLLFYADRGGDVFALRDVPELVAFIPRVVSALEKIILKRKKSSKVEFEKPAEPKARDDLKAAAKAMGSLPPPSRPSRGIDRWSTPPAEKPTSQINLPAVAPDAIAPRSLTDVITSSGMIDHKGSDVPTKPEHPVVEPEPSREASAPPPPSPDVAAVVRQPQRAAALRQMVGIPRSAPPPPSSDALELGVAPIPVAPLPTFGASKVRGVPTSVPEPTVAMGEVARVGRDTMPEALLPIQGRATEPAPPPTGDDEPEMVVGAADPDDFEGIEPSNPGIDVAKASAPTHEPRVAAPREPYLFKEAAVDVVSTRRASERPAPAAAAESPSNKRRLDPRREDDGAAPMEDRVRLTTGYARTDGRSERSEKVTANVRAASRSSPPPDESRSVIVDMGDSVNELVQDLVHAGPDEEGALVEALMRHGDASLPVLAQAFPGPLWFDRRRPHRKQPRGRDVSAIARAFVAYKDRAVPYIASLLGAADVEHRFYAAMLANELVHGGLIDALAGRLYDDDEAIRKLAAESLLKHRGLPEMVDALTVLRRTARIRGKDTTKRLRAIAGLGAIRDAGALRLLVDLLADDEGPVVHAAHLSLVALTCEDLGAGQRKWAAWADRNESRHRIEWLIDALTHGDETLRAAAGEDLKSLTQQYFGFHPAAGKKDREVVQQKYRAWWDAQGRRVHGMR
jgi:hypothetical protein